MTNHSLDGGKPKLMLKPVSCFRERTHEGYKQVYQENGLALMYVISRITNKTEIDLGLTILSAISLSRLRYR